MPRSARKEGYSRRHRFSARGSFGPVLRSPRKLRGRYAILHVLDRPGHPSRLGIALTRRHIPDATHRNRVKRLLREVFRRHPVKLAGLDCVVTVRERLGEGDAARLGGEVRAFFDRLAPSP